MTVRAVSSNPTSPFYNASAPTLTGQTGSLTAVLDAVLVNGFSGFTALGWTIGFTTTSKRAYLQNQTGANNASGMYLYVDDTGPGAGTFKEARACGFETMSAITPTGTGQFPTSGQSAVGVGMLVIRKSATADATARYWTIVGNGQTIYLFIETGDLTAPFAAMPFMFGDFFSYKTSDSYAVAIVGRTVENSTSPNVDWLHMLSCVANNNLVGVTGYMMLNTMSGHFVARSWTGVGGSVRVGKIIDMTKMGITQNSNASTNSIQGGWTSDGGTQTSVGSASVALGRSTYQGSFPYPNGPDGACWISPIWINHSNSVRGYFKGLWAPLHDRPLNHNDTYTVSGGNLNGKSIAVQAIAAYIGAAADSGQIHVETSDTWA
jgi:hypothetical protein